MLAPLNLPDFPWDTISEARTRAEEHAGGIVDLSVGTPVDATPEVVQNALRASSDSPGYPLVAGTQQVRDAIRAWVQHRGMVDPGESGVLPTTGSKEIVAWMPRMLGAREGNVILFPDVAYPTYEVGANLAGAVPLAVNQADVSTWPNTADIVWLNSPSNPTGQVLSADQLKSVVRWARERNALVVADECYAELPWSQRYRDEGVPSLLHPAVCEGDVSGLLVVYSLSKQSNMAGYRAGVVVGDPQLVQALLEVRKHGGMMVPAPVQAAMSAALTDRAHVDEQYERYRERRRKLAAALSRAGFELDESNEAGLYLWVTSPADWAGKTDQSAVGGRALLNWFAARGILVAPGDFYGPTARNHVRIALTATDERIDAACERIES
ncbi:succinyldiaminopimelate transaminase [Actinomyces sp. F1_1611]